MWQLSPRLYNWLQWYVHGDYARIGCRLIAAHRSLAPAIALELGCGTGNLARFFRAGSYVGLDLDPQRIATARARHPEHEFEVGDAVEPSATLLARCSFVFCHAWLHHLNDDEIRRFLDHFTAAARTNAQSIQVLALEPVMPARRWLNPLGAMIASGDRGGRVRTQPSIEALLASKLVRSEAVAPQWNWPVPGVALWLQFPGA